MNSPSPDPLELCRTLLAYTNPGTAVVVPHAALAAVVELASGSPISDEPSGAAGDAPSFFDVAALARRYSRAPATVRQWFAAGLFGPPRERRFRGRGYVAPGEAVREFEERTGLRSGPREEPPAAIPAGALPTSAASSGVPNGRVGSRIRAAARGQDPVR